MTVDVEDLRSRALTKATILHRVTPEFGLAQIHYRSFQALGETLKFPR